jgi:hypothetical protein
VATANESAESHKDHGGLDFDSQLNNLDDAATVNSARSIHYFNCESHFPVFYVGFLDESSDSKQIEANFGQTL